ncbi:MAG: hypothetical protein EAZ24_01185 [Burkholderiales bacterium]|nr:MAG: hypothetical protein EAZ21_11230 [Betaproteobacteria bacterium]TAG84507.1 MAG: hypothetical protein EAZ24_01185 [Burkholderiales bacterium]
MLRSFWLRRALFGLISVLLFVVTLAVAAVAATLVAGGIATASWALLAPALAVLVLATVCGLIALSVKPTLIYPSTLDMLRKDLDLLSEIGAGS